MSIEGAKKVLAVLDTMIVLLCCCVAVIGIWQNNAPAACGWLFAALAYMRMNEAVKMSYRLESIVDKAMEIINHIHKIKAGDGDGDADKSPEKELPDFALDAVISFKECASEFFHYINDGTREFSISHGGISINVRIPENAPEREVSGDQG